MPEPSVLLTHGPLLYWMATALVGLTAPLLAWSIARARARALAASALEELGPATARPGAEGEVAVLSGVLELEGTSALVHDPPDVRPADTIGASIETAAYLRMGDTRIALEGELQLRAGSRERWGLSRRPVRSSLDRNAAVRAATQLAARHRRIAHGQPVRARGVERLVYAGGDEPYREARTRTVLVPEREGGRIELAAEGRPRVGLNASTIAGTLTLAAALFTSVAYAAGRSAEQAAWDATTGHSTDLEHARRTMRWGQLAAAVPFHRESALRAIDAALTPDARANLDAQRELVLLAASHALYRHGTCRQLLGSIESAASYRLLGEIGESCGDATSLRVAARARLRLGELERAADLAARAGSLDSTRPDEQLALEYSASVLTGRLEPAAAALRQMGARGREILRPRDPTEDSAERLRRLPVELGCAADQLMARAGDPAARGRLERAMTTATPPRARGVCAALLADLASGAERLALIDRIRGDAGIQVLEELHLLEVETDPARGAAPSGLVHIGLPAEILGGTSFRFSALRWSALERLAALSDPPIAARRLRARLAAEAASAASNLGADAAALRWTELLARDWDVLRAEMEGGSGPQMLRDQLDELALQRAYIELRAGRIPQRPRRQPGTSKPRRGLDDEWRELEGVLDFAARGELDKLRQTGELATFAQSGRVLDGAFEGLEVAAGGAGENLALWLTRKPTSDDLLGVALLGARRLTTGKREMHAWLRRRAPGDQVWTSLATTATRAATRQKIAEVLGDRTLATELRLQAERIRRGLLRRDTAMVRTLLPVE